MSKSTCLIEKLGLRGGIQAGGTIAVDPGFGTPYHGLLHSLEVTAVVSGKIGPSPFCMGDHPL